MRRAGRLGDGWIPSFIPPDRFRTGVELTHYCLDRDAAAARATAAPFLPRGRVDDATLERCTAFGPPALLRERLEEYVAGGGSKFIVRPMCAPERMLEQLEQLAEEVIPAFHRR
jgi:alkanesulfonate monooxygenase SsuD/methylene tetrahydromethanopterin reductase-like flavin-dependent oxidoreductase (luciferase family)